MDIIDKANEVRDIISICNGLAAAQKQRDGSIIASFKRLGKGR